MGKSSRGKKGRKPVKRRVLTSRKRPIRTGSKWGLVPAILASAYFLLLPFVMSFTGFDTFRIPKDVFAAICILALFLSLVLLGRFSYSVSLWSWEFVLFLGTVYTAFHVALSPGQGSGLEGLLAILLFSLLFVSLKAILSFDFQKWIWLAISGVLAINASLTVLQYFGMVEGMTNATGVVLSGRLNPAGFVGEVNSGGFLFGLAALMSIYHLAIENGIWVKVTASLLLVMNLTGLAFTRTLTAVAGLSACAVLWLIFHHWWLLRGAKRVTRPLVALWLILVLGFGAVFLVGYKAGVVERIQSVVNLARKGEWSFATAGRQPVYYLAWEMIKERPVFGHGLNTFRKEFFYFRSDTEVGQSVQLLSQPGAFRQVHNEYLQVWEELGVIGLVFLLLLLGIPIIRSVSLLRSEPDRKRLYWIGVSTIGLVFIAISCLSFFPLHLSITATYIVLVVAGLRCFQSGADAPQRGGRTTSSRGADDSTSVKTDSAVHVPALARRLFDLLPARLELRLSVPAGIRGGVLGRALLLVLALLLGFLQVERWLSNQEVGLAAYLLKQSSGSRFRPSQKRVMADEALSRLERAESLDDGFGEIHNLKGSALMLAGRYGLARESYSEASRRLPSPEVFTNLAAACMATEQWEDARKYVNQALRYDPAFPKAREALRYLKKKAKSHADRD